MNAFIHWLEHHMLACPYKAVTGIDCPGCGIQRAFVALLKGDIVESFHLYPALIPTIFTLLFTAVHLYFKFRNGAGIVKYSFMGTVAIMMVSYLFKMFAPHP